MTKKELQTTIGRNIKEVRARKNISAQELAGRCNFEKSTMSRLEAGNTNPTIFTLYKISQALGVRLADLMKGL